MQSRFEGNDVTEKGFQNTGEVPLAPDIHPLSLEPDAIEEEQDVDSGLIHVILSHVFPFLTFFSRIQINVYAMHMLTTTDPQERSYATGLMWFILVFVYGSIAVQLRETPTVIALLSSITVTLYETYDLQTAMKFVIYGGIYQAFLILMELTSTWPERIIYSSLTFTIMIVEELMFIILEEE